MDNKPIEITLWPYDFDAASDGRIEYIFTRFKMDFITGAHIILKEFLPVGQVYSGRILHARIQKIVVYPLEFPQVLYCTIYLQPIKTGTVI